MASSFKDKTLKALSHCKRTGIEDLLRKMEEKGYFEAPASAGHHLSVPGGLAQHSILVLERFHKKNRELKLGLSTESVIITSICHDLCKMQAYQKDGDTFKRSDKVKHHHHGAISLFMATRCIELSEEEAAIIKFHMGVPGALEHKDFSVEELHQAMYKWPSIVVFAACDWESMLFELTL